MLFLFTSTPALAYTFSDLEHAAARGMSAASLETIASDLEPLSAEQAIELLRVGVDAQTLQAITDGAHPTEDEVRAAAEAGPLALSPEEAPPPPPPSHERSVPLGEAPRSPIRTNGGFYTVAGETVAWGGVVERLRAEPASARPARNAQAAGVVSAVGTTLAVATAVFGAGYALSTDCSAPGINAAVCQNMQMTNLGISVLAGAGIGLTVTLPASLAGRTARARAVAAYNEALR